MTFENRCGENSLRYIFWDALRRNSLRLKHAAQKGGKDIIVLIPSKENGANSETCRLGLQTETHRLGF